MESIFAFSSAELVRPLLIATGALVLVLLVLALRSPHIVRIGLRNVWRRPARTLLILAGLMLSTTFIAAAFAIDDTVSLAVRTVAVYDLGSVDEDVTTTPLGLFNADVGHAMARALANSRGIAGIAPTLEVTNLLVADQTARQVRGTVTGVGFAPAAAGTLGDLRAADGTSAPISALGSNQIYLNTSLAAMLDARPGDTVDLYSTRWPGQRYTFTVRAIVSGGMLAEPPSIVLPLATLQQLIGAPDAINHIYVANAGTGLAAAARTDEVASELQSVTPDGLGVRTVKQDGIQLAVEAEGIFGRILALFTLFALAIGLLLIFLIFVLLAAERRSELGTLRALGMRRSRVVLLLVVEGAVYDALAAGAGVLVGLGLSVLLVRVVSPIVTSIGFPLSLAIQPDSLIVAFCLGWLATCLTMVLAAFVVTRLTITAALRDLPEPPTAEATLPALLRALVCGLLRARRQAPVSVGTLVRGVVMRGLVPLALGWVLLTKARSTGDAFLFSLALSMLLVGVVLTARWLLFVALVGGLRLRHAREPVIQLARARRLADRVAALLIGGVLVLYWSLPFDVPQRWGVGRFAGGMEVFFVAGAMMIAGAVWALAPNLDLLLKPVGMLLAGLVRARHVVRISLLYPAYHRARTGIGLALFALVCFTMVMVACIAASTTANYDTLPQQAAQYDVAGQPLFAPVGGVRALDAVLQHDASGTADQIAAISAAQSLPLALLAPDQKTPGWRFYPASEVQGAFLDGLGLPLVARASGFSSDAAVWQAVRTHPGDVVIDSAALSPQVAATLGIRQPVAPDVTRYIAPPIAAGIPGLANLSYTDDGVTGADLDTQGLPPEAAAVAQNPATLSSLELSLGTQVLGRGLIAPIPLWATDLRGGPATRLTIIGIVNNAQGQRYGLFGAPATFATAEHGLPALSNEYYYFQVRPGADAHAVARQLGSVLLNHGFETTVIADALLDYGGPSVFLSRVLVGLLGLTLLVGMAALAVTGSRAVVERRQQIGMLRALGFRKAQVQAIFLIESVLVGTLGAFLGMGLGLVLCRNIFAVNFFAQFASKLPLVVPWRELGVICAAAILAATVAALLPAWQAGRIAPADALRYE